MRLWSLLLVYIFFVGTATGQIFSFERISTSEGLSQNDVNDILQDSDGFLWICTNDGLNRFDGYSFKTFRVEPGVANGLTSNLIYRICEGADGALWIGTSDKGTFKFDKRTGKFYSLSDLCINPVHIPALENVTGIAASRSGDIWVGTPAGIGYYKRKGELFELNFITKKEFPALQSLIVTDIEADTWGRVWVGTQSGMYLFTESEGGIRMSVLVSGNYVHDIFVGDIGYAATFAEGVFLFQPDQDSETGYTMKKVFSQNSTSMLISKTGDVFVGTNHGMYYFKRESVDPLSYAAPEYYAQSWEQGSLSKNVITALFEDKSGIVWIGTNGGGLNKCNPKKKKFRHYARTKDKGSLSYNKIRYIYEDSRKNIWIGTEGGGLNLLPAGAGKNFQTGFVHVDVNTAERQNHVYTLIEIAGGEEPDILAGLGYPSVTKVYSASKGRIVEKDYPIFKTLANSPFSTCKDRNGHIWIGTYGSTGLYRYYRDENGKEVLLNYRADEKKGHLGSNIIRSLMQDSYGNIWIGTNKGLNLIKAEDLDKPDPYFYVFRNNPDDPNSLSHDYVLPLFQSSDKTIWVGTMGGGLNKVHYHPNPDSIRFEAITTRDGLPNNVIKGILEDNYGFLWIASNKGLTRYDIADRIVVNYDVSDGLQDNEFGELACCKLSDGEMLFGGVNGFNAFYPNEIVSDMTTPDIALTEFHILNKEVHPGELVNGRVLLSQVINHTDEIRLKYSENSFSIYFASLHFAAPQKNVYKYKLEGFDSDWVRKDASDRIAKYTNLNPGEYVFKVLASNNDGIWTGQPKTLRIIITPPWYLSTWAWIAYVVLFLIALWFFQRYSLIRIQQKNELIMEHFEKEKIQELSQMKLRFFTNISHEFRTPLTLILGPLEKLIKKGGYDKETEENFSIMYRNAAILLRLINQLIDFRKFEQGKMKLQAAESNIVPFVKDVYSSFSVLARDKNINYNFLPSSAEIKVFFDGEKLERILYNLLSNAFKFTPENGQIDLVVAEEEGHVVIEVSDTGIGIPADQQAHIFERFYQATQIKNHKVGSTGIGLSFIKGLVELHKGEISFESEEGKGTSFFVKLPKGSAHLSPEEISDKVDVVPEGRIVIPEPVVAKEKSKEEDVPSGDKKRVLLVEDNFELRKYIRDSLKHKYLIAVADNGKEGLEKALSFNPDVIVSDIMMPVMSGYELCEAVKSDESISHIPVILLTARSTAENRIKGYRLGADAYISKPFKMEMLEVRIENLIETREQLRQKLRGTVTIEPSEVTTTSADEKFLKRLLRIVEEHISDPDLKVSYLASECGMSQVVLNRKVKSLTGQSPKVFIRSIRLKRAAQLLATNNYSIAEVAYEVGFLDVKYFRSCFKEEFGMLPSDYKSQASDDD